MKNTYFVLLTMVFILQASVGWAQRFDRERFGKNRVQHKELQWFYYSSNNFEVYYYDQGMNNARMAIDFLESEFDRLTQSIGYVAYTKPKIFIYNSPEEILQSNLNLNKDEYTIDGQTFFSRLLGEVAFPGNWDDFKKDLIYVTSKVIIEEMLYGSSIVDAFQSNLVNRFPDWYVDGAAMYLAHGWSREMDDYIRHYFKREGQKVRLYKLQEQEAALVGQSIWNFIGERYGKRYISSILNLSRINRNEEASIANTIGMDYKNVMTQWQTFYTSVNKPVFDVFKAVKETSIIAETSDRQFGAITDIKFSPDSKHLAYVINNGGRYRVQVRELATERETTLYTGGSVSKDQPVNTTSPVIAWRDTLNLAIATFRGGVTTLRQRAIDGSSNDKIYLRNITQITHMDYNASGRNIVMSVISAGRSDIYTLNARGQGRRVTNDVFDNLTPMWLNDSTIIFSSNQVDLPDSVLTRTPDANKLPGYFNLWKADVDSVVTFERLTNVNYRNVRPMRLNSDNILYLSDQSGITNLNRMSVASTVSSQVSALNKSIEVFDYSSQLNRIAYAVRDGNKARLVYEPYSNSDQFTPSTPRMQLAQAKQLNERMNAAESGAQRRTSREQEEEEVSETELIVLPERISSTSEGEVAEAEGVREETEQVQVEAEVQTEQEVREEELEEQVQEVLEVIAEEVESSTEEAVSTEETAEGEAQALRRTERETVESDTTRRAGTSPPAGVNLEELLIGAPSRAGTPRAAATQGAATQGAAGQAAAQAGEGPAPQGGVLDQFRRMQSPTFERLPEVMLGDVSDTVPPRTGGSGRIDTQGLRFEGRGGIDYENYTFDTIPALQDFQQEPRRNLAGRNALLENFRRQGLQRRITGPRRITPQFMTSSFRTNFVIDPLRGFGIALNGEMNDLLDNHRIKGGIMAALDFRSGSDVFFDYEYLKRRLDFRFRYDRSALQVSEGETFQRYVLNKAELGVSYPLNVHSRLTLAPFYANTQYFNLNPDSLLRATDREANSLMVNYAGARAEFVVDKTTQLGLYMQQGFKAKAGFAHFQGLNAADRSFSNFYLDVRNYQKVVKNITFASRLFVGSFFGNNPQTYLVGGMDNWVFNRFSQPAANRNEPSPVRNPTGVENSNILFAEFVDLRGYDLDEIRGNNVITFTSEIRVPIFSFLSRGNLTSNFLRNFQMVGFYDIGSAWNEAAPWERVNDQNTEVIRTPASPFTITLNNFNNPWLQSYGAGIRTVLLNYYVKMDVARPIRNNQPENLRLYVTLGYNF